MNRISIAIFGLSFGLSCHCVHRCVQIRGVIMCKSYTQHVIVCMFYKNGRSVFIGTVVKTQEEIEWSSLLLFGLCTLVLFLLQKKKEKNNYLWIEISCLITYSLDFVSVLPICWVALDFSGGRVHRWSFFKVETYNQPYAILGTKHRKKMGKIQVKYKHTHTHTRTHIYRLTILILGNICATLLVYAMVYCLPFSYYYYFEWWGTSSRQGPLNPPLSSKPWMHDLGHKNHAPSNPKTWSQDLEEHTRRPINPNNL